LHYHLSDQLKGEGTRPSLPVPDEVLIRLCRASVSRVATWSAQKKMTNDWGFAGTVKGRETGELIQLSFEHASDKDRMRRELAPCIDQLGDSGLLELATELRLYLRRG
jgi:hypothetical protein